MGVSKIDMLMGFQKDKGAYIACQVARSRLDGRCFNEIVPRVKGFSPSLSSTFITVEDWM